MKCHLLRCLGLLLALLVLVPTADATAQPRPNSEAATRFERGIALYEEGDFQGALVESLALFQLGDYAGSVTALRRYLVEGDKDVPPEKREAIQAEIAKLEQRVGSIEVTVDVDGAVVFLDGKEVGTAPLPEPVLVSIGARRVGARLGAREVEQTVEVAGGDTLKLELTLPPAITVVEPPPPQPDAPLPIPQPEQPPEPGVSAGVVVSWIAVGALVAGAVGVGVAALDASADVEDLRSTFGSTQAERDEAVSETARLAIATDVLIGAAIVMTGVAIYITATDGEDDSPDKAANEAAANEVVLDLRVSPFGIEVVGHF
jgi:hypothetical protein